ncbi:MAG: PRC-barrel domain-containing protein [Syntrophothermaceae bacterium]|jgi:uncharacterized protein YrrD
MKKSQEIIGLPVFSVVDGREVGQVKDLVINPEEGVVEYVLVNGGSWYVGARVLPYRAVLGIGAHAVTTESETQLTNLNESSNANALLERSIKVKGTKVLTRKGNLIGVVSEYEVDENTGKITGLEFRAMEGDSEITAIQASQVLTFGKDVIVVQERLGSDPNSFQKADESRSETGVAAESDAARLFIEKQKQFLLGKKLMQDIKDDEGNILIAAGTEIDDHVLEVAEVSGRLNDLGQNAK